MENFMIQTFRSSLVSFISLIRPIFIAFVSNIIVNSIVYNQKFYIDSFYNQIDYVLRLISLSNVKIKIVIFIGLVGPNFFVLSVLCLNYLLIHE